MKVLLYNWIPFDNEAGRGGGVTVYLKNLIHEIIEHREKDIELFFLSSGCYYDIYNTSVRYEEISNLYGKKCRTFSIINSPVFSPAYLSFYYLDKVIKDEKLRNILNQFLNEFGPFDVVHFHNFEGLSIPTLECKMSHPDTKFIYTLHNYYPFCPQVNLWKEESKNCKEIHTGEVCINCMDAHVPCDKLHHKMAMTYNLLKNPSERLKKAYQYCGAKLDSYYEVFEKEKIVDSEKERLAKALSSYRKVFVETINQNIDTVLAVSKRVYTIAVNMGIEVNKVHTSYIGTKVADFALNCSNSHCKDGILSIIYMGYQRLDKGYYFLVEVLNKMPIELSKKIDVTLIAKKNPNPKFKDVEIEKRKFHRFTSKNGYTKDEMPLLLKDKNLGIIPVLWEDNLPQIAIEMTAFGVPVLASNLGGASELCNSNAFTFKAGDVKDCIDKITYFSNNPDKLDDYWKYYRKLTTMEQHMEEIMEYWS